MDFTPEQRNIFKYHDGESLVCGDPLELQMRLAVNLPDAAKVVETINRADAAKGDPQAVYAAWQAYEKLWLAVREAFQMQEYDRTTGKGATSAQCVAVWNQFSRWMAAVKKNGVTPPTSPPSTESAPSSSTTPATAA